MTPLAATECNRAGAVTTETRREGRGRWFVSGRFLTSERQSFGGDVDEPGAQWAPRMLGSTETHHVVTRPLLATEPRVSSRQMAMGGGNEGNNGGDPAPGQGRTRQPGVGQATGHPPRSEGEDEAFAVQWYLTSACWCSAVQCQIIWKNIYPDGI